MFEVTAVIKGKFMKIFEGFSSTSLLTVAEGMGGKFVIGWIKTSIGETLT